MKKISLLLCGVAGLFFFSTLLWAQISEPLAPQEQSVQTQQPDPPPPPKKPEPQSPSVSSPDAKRLVSLDFDNVDLPVLIKFIGELTMKNFVIDEQVRGKVTLFSPTKIPVEKAYDVFLSVLEMKGFKVIPAGVVSKIVPLAVAPVPRSTHVYTVENADVDEVSKVLLGVVARAPTPGRQQDPSQIGEIADKVDVVTDKATNRLIITASDQDYPIVEKIIKDIDVAKRQVYVEALVLEMGSDKLRELGTDLGALFGYKRDSGKLFGIGSLNEAGLPGLGALLGVTSTSTSLGALDGAITVKTFLNALQSEPNVNVLSTPQLLTSDRQKAEIVVGQNVPFPGAQSQTTGGNVQTTIERKDVGITLRMTPVIMANNKVKMDLFQEISSVVATAGVQAGSGGLGPTTNKRSATTNVIVGDGQTAVIAGLIRDDVIVTTQSVPFLGSIPILGWLFKKETSRTEKTNLLIFVTPYIVPDGSGAGSLDAIREKKLQGTLDFMEKNKVKGIDQRKEVMEQMIGPTKKTGE